MNELKELYEAARRGTIFRRRLSYKNLHVYEPDFDQALREEVEKVFSVDPDFVVSGETWNDLVELFGEPKEKDYLSRELFCAFIKTNNWLKSIGDWVTDEFEQDICAAFCLMWGYLYDRFGHAMMDVIGELENDEAAQFYEDALN